jgi:hypothetical protein
MDEDMLDDMGGTPTPMNANRAQQAYAAARGDKRKRKVGNAAGVCLGCRLMSMLQACVVA